MKPSDRETRLKFAAIWSPQVKHNLTQYQLGMMLTYLPSSYRDTMVDKLLDSLWRPEESQSPKNWTYNRKQPPGSLP